LSDTSKKEPTTMLAVRLDTQMEAALAKLAAATVRSKSCCVKEALAA
jgi:predicted transcriptional regulator